MYIYYYTYAYSLNTYEIFFSVIYTVLNTLLGTDREKNRFCPYSKSFSECTHVRTRERVGANASYILSFIGDIVHTRCTCIIRVLSRRRRRLRPT